MKPIAIDIPVPETIVPGDCAEVTINGSLTQRVDLLPGQSRHAGHLGGAWLIAALLANPPASGWHEGAHLADPYLVPQPHIDADTPDQYFGRYDVGVQVIDALGNPSADPSFSQSLFINTGPRGPSNLRFGSQAGAGPITFTFDSSPEVANG